MTLQNHTEAPHSLHQSTPSHTQPIRIPTLKHRRSPNRPHIPQCNNPPHTTQAPSPDGEPDYTQHADRYTRTNKTHIVQLCEYHPSEYQWNCSRPSPIGNPFHTADTADDATPSPKDHSATNSAFSTALYSILSGETSTLATIAAHHNLPATCIQPPYKDMKWALYSDNFKRTLSRLQLYRLSLNRQNPDKSYHPPSPHERKPPLLQPSPALSRLARFRYPTSTPDPPHHSVTHQTGISYATSARSPLPTTS